MDPTTRRRWWMRLSGYLSLALFLAVIGLLAWLSTRYNVSADWTSNGRNSLSPTSIELLQVLNNPVNITAYASPNPPLRERIEDLIERYTRVKHDVELRFVDPATAPDELRKLGIAADGELVVSYEGRSEHVQQHTEQALTNALQRVARGSDRFLVFLSGHGERSPFGQTSRDIGSWVQQLTNRGLKAQELNLGTTGSVPDNTAALVIASPEVDLLPGEVEIIKGYLDRGGNLLWLIEPNSLRGLEPIAKMFGLVFTPGTIIDATSQMFGINRPEMTVLASYGEHPATAGFKYVSLLPFAAPVRVEQRQDWNAQAVLETTENAWSETGKLEGEVRYDEGFDTKGPLTVAVSLSRPRPEAKDESKEEEKKDEKSEADKQPPPEQRIMVIGDGDFIANEYLGNSGNLDLGVRLVSWVAADDQMVKISARTATDSTLELTRGQMLGIVFGSLFLIPLILIANGVGVWLRRRRA